jgi:ribosomal protein S18 acetylase RimI-like enzyme
LEPNDDIELHGLCLSDRVIRDVRRVLAREGPAGLEVDDLVRDDLRSLGWSGGAAHLASVGRALDRVESGEVEYLVVRAPTGYPIAKGCIDYRVEPGTGTLCQLVTADELRGLGIGARLIAVAEARMRRRGVRTAELGVEDDNPRARALYERLGYSEVRRESAAWNIEDADGALILYEAELAVLRKRL